MRRLKSYRLPLELIERVERAAAGERTTATALVERGLNLVLVEEGAATAATAPSPPEPAVSVGSPSRSGSDTVGVAGWLAGRTGKPIAVTKAYIASGRVLLDGEPAPATAPPEVLEGHVTLDGEPV